VVLLRERRLQGLVFALQVLLPRTRGRGGLKGASEVLESLLLPVVEDAGLQLVLLAELRNGDRVHEMPPEDGDLLLGGELATGLTGRGFFTCRSLCSGGESQDSLGAVHDDLDDPPQRMLRDG